MNEEYDMENYRMIMEDFSESKVAAMLSIAETGIAKDLAMITSPLTFMILEIIKTSKEQQETIKQQQQQIVTLQRAHESLMLLFADEIDK